MYNLRKIMLKAWKNYRKQKDLEFPEALHRSWLSAKAEPINEKRIADAKAVAGITEDINTWAGWKELGREVIHGSQALFGTELIWNSRGDNKTYKANFFGISQTKEIPS